MNNLRPRWLATAQRHAPPPAPPAGTNPIEAALDDYETLRANYANLVAQSLEDQALLRELGHRNEALEHTLHEDRQYFGTEMARLQKERDMLSAFAVQIITRMSTMVDIVEAIKQEAQLGAVADLLASNNEQESPVDTAGIVRINPREHSEE